MLVRSKVAKKFISSVQNVGKSMCVYYNFVDEFTISFSTFDKSDHSNLVKLEGSNREGSF